ncbi:uncharacterized protein LOC113286124 [Papaver somniferum]|uniref:uncharacterized protein LOC113286124 n=1 Tax=Papaver somniferum TaxID=3469 RepID=UPI000E701101|nr:uncharacterized protein LOC113286124 [Papaver somniferum]
MPCSAHLCDVFGFSFLPTVYGTLAHNLDMPFVSFEAYSVGHQYEKFSDYPWCADICAVLVGTNCTALSFLVFLRCFVNIHAIYKKWLLKAWLQTVLDKEEPQVVLASHV